MGFLYVETSARTGEGVNELVSAMLPELIAPLWCGSRDGFRAREFHRRYGGHGNTLTPIRDTEWNLFGGFAPIEWESPFFWETEKE
jgi:hypothetical protein